MNLLDFLDAVDLQPLGPPPCARDIFLPHVDGRPTEPSHYALSWHHARRLWPDHQLCAYDAGLTTAERIDLGRDGVLLLSPFDEPPPHDDADAPPDLVEAPPWPDLQPLPPLVPPAPELPAELVPEALRDWVVGEAADLCTPLAGVAAPAIVALSAIVGRGARINPEPGNPWTVIPNLWGCTVAPPGLLKSPALQVATRPLEPLIRREHERTEALETDLLPQRLALEAQLAKAKRKGDVDPHELRRLIDKIEAAKVRPRRYVVQDASLEKLQEIQRDNPRGMLLLRDELAGWLASLAKQGHEADRGYYLEAWDGDKSSTVDRIGRGTVYVPANCLSLYGTIQPARLEPLLQGVRDGTGDDGLLQRLQLLVFVDSLPQWVADRQGCVRADRARVERIFEALDGALAAYAPKTMAFDGPAQEFFDSWRSELEHRIRAGDLRAQPVKCGHLAKYRSLLPSLAALFHLLHEVDDVLQGQPPTPGQADVIRVCRPCVELAAAWCRYLEAHVDRLHVGACGPELRAAHLLAAKITDRSVTSGQSIRDIYRRQWSGLTDSDAVNAAVTELTRVGWVRRETVTTGGRPSVTITLSPLLQNGAFRQFRQYGGFSSIDKSYRVNNGK